MNTRKLPNRALAVLTTFGVIIGAFFPFAFLPQLISAGTFDQNSCLSRLAFTGCIRVRGRTLPSPVSDAILPSAASGCFSRIVSGLSDWTFRQSCIQASVLNRLCDLLLRHMRHSALTKGLKLKRRRKQLEQAKSDE